MKAAGHRERAGARGRCLPGALREDDVVAAAGDVAEGVAGVDDELGVVCDELIVVGGVMRGDEDGVVAGEGLGGEFDGLEAEVAVAAHFVRAWDVGVVVVDVGAELSESLDELEAGGLADVVDVGLVGEAEDEDL